MRGLRQILGLITQIFFCAICFAQREKIDSLKKVLLTAKDTQRINCLNALSETYQETQTDSALSYSYEALNEAKRKQYNKGVAEAFFNLANSHAQRGDYKSAEQNFRLSISNYEKLSNVDALGRAYLWFGVSLYAQSNFQLATQAFVKAEQQFKKAKDTQGSNQILFFLAFNYEQSGLYEEAFELGTKSLNEAQKNNDQQFFFYSLLNMGRLYQNVEDYRTALDYYQQASSLAEKHRLASQLCTFCSLTLTAKLYMGEVYSCMENFDSSKFYLNQVLTFFKAGTKDSSARKEQIMLLTESLGELYLRQKDYDKALANFSETINFWIWGNNRNYLMRVLLNTGKAYEGKKEYGIALDYAKKLLSLAKETGAKQFIRDGTGLMWNIYDELELADSAYKYYRQYASMKDSLINVRYIRQLALFKQQSEYGKEQLQLQLALQKESLGKKIAVSILFIVILLAFITVRVIVLKRKNEKMKSKHKEAELQQQATELEMQALRAQMNPHFIFNSLNSINRFILQNNKTQASEYLTKFSKLVRLILQNSQASLISLESELDSLELYLDLESLRFDHRFGYKISVPKDLDLEALKVPPLIIQPYAENAIWHGLMHKEEKGQLDVDVSQENDQLFFKITDDGIGRKAAAALASKSATKHKSVGMKITSERIAMLQKSNNSESAVAIKDLVHEDGNAAGTEVIIRLPVLYE